MREREFDRVYERQLLKEQEQDKDTYGDTERFVTAAYKKQLQESRKWDAEDRRMDEVEERTSAQTSGMAGFYSNLLTRNIAAGADVEKAAVSSYTHGSRRNAFVDEGPSSVVPQQEEDAAASALARFEDAVPPSAEDERKARAAFAASRGYDAVAERLAKVEEEDVKPPPPVVEAPQVAPQDAAAAARERFLARKRERAARGK